MAPIIDSGEPLVSLQKTCPEIVTGAKPLFARRGVALRLRIAQHWIDANRPGYRIGVGEAYRSLERQRRIFRLLWRLIRVLRPFWPTARVQTMTARYIADPDAADPPPHTTGGAVDVHLFGPDGKRVWMGPFTLRATRTVCEILPDSARRNRAIIIAAMEHAGFSNYEEEWWHWSYGDSDWALRKGAPAAIYGGIVPPSE